MHKGCFDYVAINLPWDITKNTTVVEFGSRDVNGTILPLLGQAQYTGVDIEPGPNVDIVCDCRDFLGHGDIVLCLELLEHCDDLDGVIQAIFDTLEDDGIAIVTCATNPRAPHSAIDGNAVRTGEYYKNVSPTAFKKAVAKAGGKIIDLEIDKKEGDLRATLKHGDI